MFYLHLYLGVPSLASHLDNIGPMTAHTRTRPANHRQPVKLHVISAPLATCTVFCLSAHRRWNLGFFCGLGTNGGNFWRLPAHEDSGNSRGRTEQDRKGAPPGLRSQVLLDESLTRHFLPGDRDNLSRASSQILLPSLLSSSAALNSCSPPTMALVTLQRSLTPSAASSASTTNSSVGEVSGKAGARSLCT